MNLTSFIVKKAAPVPRPETFEKYLFIGPHPDDIEIGAGAMIARLTSEGKQVSFLICMDGRYGLEHAPEGITPEELIRVREAESLRSARVLGVTDVRFLRLSDGGFYDEKELLEGMARVIGEIKPDILFAPDPDVDSECHPDHLNTAKAAKTLTFFAPFQNIMEKYGAEAAPVKAVAFYMTARPNRFVRTGAFRDKQSEAILCHKSQFPEDSDAYAQVALYLKVRSLTFGLKSLKGNAEGFRVLGTTQMHCLPEAGI